MTALYQVFLNAVRAVIEWMLDFSDEDNSMYADEEG